MSQLRQLFTLHWMQSLPFAAKEYPKSWHLMQEVDFKLKKPSLHVMHFPDSSQVMQLDMHSS